MEAQNDFSLIEFVIHKNNLSGVAEMEIIQQNQNLSFWIKKMKQ